MFYASLINQSGSFAVPAVMGGTGDALSSQSTLTHKLQWSNGPYPEPGVRETSFKAIPQPIITLLPNVRNIISFSRRSIDKFKRQYICYYGTCIEM